MAENPRIVATNPVFPETRALLEENATVDDQSVARAVDL